MGNALKILSVLLVILGLVGGGVGAAFMFVIVPQQEKNAEFPVDFDDHYTYGGYIDQLNTSTGEMPRVPFTVDRHIVNTGKLDNGHYLVNETVTVTENSTGAQLPALSSYHEYEVHHKDLRLYKVTDGTNVIDEYTDADDVNWIFPIPVEKRDYDIWSMNINDYSKAKYLGEETRGGIDCYVFRGEEIEYEVPLPPELAAALPSFIADNTTATLTLWEKAWVHPMTGIIVDYAKEVKQYIHLPELPAVPDIKYPSDLMSVTGFDGNLVLFDQATGTFATMNGILAERTVEVVSADGDTYTANETVNVFAPDGSPIDLLGSLVQVIFNASTGANDGMGRSGQYLFPPTGVGQKNYSIWDDGFGKELTAVFTGVDNTTFAPLEANVYTIDVEGLAYAAGGTADLEMTYWVEPQTGIVLDVDKHLVNWRAQPARRLPLDTAMINNTVHMNATISTLNPLTREANSTDLIIEQQINCSGYTDQTYSVAMMEEKVTKLLPNGTLMEASTVDRFGVNAITMEYVNAANWSTVDRSGVFTFPVGLLNRTGNLTPSFVLYNSDLGLSFPAVLTGQVDQGGQSAAVYSMILSDIPLTGAQVAAVTGQELEIPGASFLYGCNITYTVDIDTGTILDVGRSMTITVVPPSYEYLWDNLNSTTVLLGSFMGENLTGNQTMVGSEAENGTTLLTIHKTLKYDNGTDFIPPEDMEVLINTSSHMMLYPNGTPIGLYFLFPAHPTSPAYPMAFTFAGSKIVSAAVRGVESEGSVAYNWTGTSVIDAGIVSPPMTGASLNLTLKYNFIVDANTGIVLDTNAEIILENMSISFAADLHFVSSEGTRASAALGNAVMGWAIDGTPVDILDVEMSLYDQEVTYNIGKAAFTSGLLKVADGVKPALDLHIFFNETTKATMKQTALATKALLDQIPGLISLHGMKTLLAAHNDQVAYVYYKQVDKDVNDNKGSVAYWSGEAKAVDDDLDLYGTTIPIVLYVIMVFLVLVGVAMVLAGPKEEVEEEEEEAVGEEEETTEEEGEKEESEE